jgi:hypothetical protein
MNPHYILSNNISKGNKSYKSNFLIPKLMAKVDERLGNEINVLKTYERCFKISELCKKICHSKSVFSK